MKLRALVLEDEFPTRNYLVELIEGTGLAEVVGAVATIAEAREVLAGLSVDVALIDVQLAGADNGLSLVRSLAGTPNAPAMVLATAFEDHSLEAFELGVVDYLLKPFSEERVEKCLKRVAERHSAAPRSGPLRVVARRKKSLVFLDPAEIWAFEAADRLTFVHCRQGKFDIDLSLAATEASFGRSFTRVHRNWLVNIAFVRELEREEGETSLLVGPEVGDETRGIRIPVSRDRAQPLRDMLLANSAGLRRP